MTRSDYWVQAFMIGLLFAAASWLLLEVNAIQDRLDVIEDQICQEDEPCWDCLTMGNYLCGVGASPAYGSARGYGGVDG